MFCRLRVMGIGSGPGLCLANDFEARDGEQLLFSVQPFGFHTADLSLLVASLVRSRASHPFEQLFAQPVHRQVSSRSIDMPAQTRARTRPARDLAASIASRKAQDLLNLPNELIVQFILPDLDLQTLVHLAQTCRTLWALMGSDVDWKQRAYRFGFTRSLLHRNQC